MPRPPIFALLVATVALLGFPAPASSWFHEGHRIVGAIADVILENHPVTRARVKNLLDNGTLADAATLPDCAKGDCDRVLTPAEQTSIKKYLNEKKNKKRHFSFHYTDVPVTAAKESKYEADSAGTEDNDIVQIIRYAIKVLRGDTHVSGPAKFDRRQALWVLTHLVGDIHQPLHVGALYYNAKCNAIVDPNNDGAGEDDFGIGSIISDTRGGNDVSVSTGGDLHGFWDGSAVDAAMKQAGKSTIEDYAKFLVQSAPTGWETKGDLDTWSAQWADDALPISRKALTDVSIITVAPGKPAFHKDKFKCDGLVATLDPTYSVWAAEQAEKQLAKAGFRLAALLREIFGDQ